jgi:glycosyltransferase involved in cell wall biosynthesis
VPLRSDITPCFIFPSLTVQAGGLTNAVRHRANFYARHFERVLVLTTDYQPDFPSVIARMRELGQLDERITVRNFYYDHEPFRRDAPAGPPVEAELDEPGLVRLPDERAVEESYRYFRPDGTPVKTKRYRGGRLLSVDSVDPGMRRLTRDDYLEDGRLRRRRSFSPTTGEPLLDTYLTAAGPALATARVHPRKGIPTRTFLLRPQPEDLSSFSTLLARWIDEEISGVPTPVVFSDQRGKSDPVLFEVRKAAKRVAVLHNNHFIDPQDRAGGVRGIFATLFDHSEDVDTMVVLTQEQLADLREDFPALPFVHISHAAPAPAEVLPAKDPGLVVLVGQLIDRKRIDHAIRAFAEVVRAVPDARLEVYGEGEEHGALSALVEELSLSGSVHLMGYSLDVGPAQQRAVCTLMTSTFEGWGLVISESMANGTPVVSYDIKYGPRDLIRDGVDGVLVTEHEPHALAEAITALLQDPARAAAMAERAREVADRFPVAEYEQKWLDVLE